MLTEVILDGAMGKKFGRKWELNVTTPSQALKLIYANIPGVFAWIRGNLDRYQNYKVLCEYENGRTEQSHDDDKSTCMEICVSPHDDPFHSYRISLIYRSVLTIVWLFRRSRASAEPLACWLCF